MKYVALAEIAKSQMISLNHLQSYRLKNNFHNDLRCYIFWKENVWYEWKALFNMTLG